MPLPKRRVKKPPKFPDLWRECSKMMAERDRELKREAEMMRLLAKQDQELKHMIQALTSCVRPTRKTPPQMPN